MKIFCFFVKRNLTVKVEKTFLGNHTILYAFCIKFGTLLIFKKFKFFFEKKLMCFSERNHHFILKNATFERFEKTFYFSRILRQICYNLVIKKIQGQNRTLVSEKSKILKWQVSVRKSRIWAF